MFKIDDTVLFSYMNSLHEIQNTLFSAVALAHFFLIIVRIVVLIAQLPTQKRAQGSIVLKHISKFFYPWSKCVILLDKYRLEA